MFSDWVNKATLDQLKCFISSDIPWAISISLDTVLKNLGNCLVFERWGDELDWEIYNIIMLSSQVIPSDIPTHYNILAQDSSDEKFEQLVLWTQNSLIQSAWY